MKAVPRGEHSHLYALHARRSTRLASTGSQPQVLRGVDDHPRIVGGGRVDHRVEVGDLAG
jgi:hypothetical protein